MPAFRTNYPARPVVPHGALLNQFGGALNATTQAIASSYRNYHGLGNQSIGEPQPIIGIARITNAGDSCPDDGFGFPCRKEHKYKAKFRYYDIDANDGEGGWRDVDGEHDVDAGAYHSNMNGYGELPLYFDGDIFAAIYFPQRVAVVPLDVPRTEFFAYLIEELNPQQSALARVIVRDYANERWAVGRTVRVHDQWMNSGEDPVEANTRIYVGRQGEIFVVLLMYCTPADNLPLV